MRSVISDLERRQNVLRQAAVNVIGEHRRAELKLGKAVTTADAIREQIQRARQLAATASTTGDPRAQEYRTAEIQLTSQLQGAEAQLVQLRANVKRGQEDSAKAKSLVAEGDRLIAKKNAELDELQAALHRATTNGFVMRSFVGMVTTAGVADPHGGDLSRDWLVRQYVATLRRLDPAATGHASDAITPRLSEIRRHSPASSSES